MRSPLLAEALMLAERAEAVLAETVLA